MSYIILDVETTIKQSYKRRANPFDADNWVVAAGWKHKGGEVEHAYYGRKRPPSGWLRDIVGAAKLIGTFNGKFDILHALQDEENLKFWMGWVANGGILFDCQLAEYLLEGMGQESQMLSLDEVAPRYGGNVKVDEVKLLWQAGVDTPDIEPELLTRYLCGGLDENGVWQEGDIGNTERIMLGQIARARECGQLNSILLNMGALIFTVEAERNGMFIDKQTGMTLAAALKIKVDEATAALALHLPADLPFDFNWNSSKQKSALFFGGTVQYDARQYDLKDGTTTWQEPNGSRLYAYAQKDETHFLLEDGSTMECLWWEHCAATEWWDSGGVPESKERVTVKSGKNTGEFKTKKVKVDDYAKPKGRIAKRDYLFKGFTKPKAKWAGADPGVWSTSSEVVKELGETSGVPFLKAYSSLMGMAKDLGTYYYTKDEDGKESGMLTLVDAEGIIHHQLNMCSTVTARLSANNPNLQNLPKGNKSDVKTVFVSRFGKHVVDNYGDMVWVPNGKIVQSDFSALEVYVQAVLTDCQQLIADLKSGVDLHCVRLAAKEKMEYAEVFKLCKGYTQEDGTYVPAVPEWDYKRTGAKVYSFQKAYGAGNKKISESTGIPLEEVEALSEAEDARYPEIPTYYADITASIKSNRKPHRVIQHPDFPGVTAHLGKSFYRTPDGKLYSYIEAPAPEYLVKKGISASFSPTEIRNYVAQGAGAEWMKAAMWLSVRLFYARGNLGGKALIVNTVHDAAYVDAADDVALEAAGMLHAAMTEASTLIEYMFKWTIPVPVPSDTSWGPSMAEENKVPGLAEATKPHRKFIRDNYLGGYTPSFDSQLPKL